MGKLLKTTGRILAEHKYRYIASTRDCGACPLKSKCCPNTPARMIPRDVNEDARDTARALSRTEAFEQSRRDCKRVEMLFAHLKRIFRLNRLRLRGPRGAQDEFTLAAIAQNLCRLVNLQENAFQSPAVHKAGRFISDAVAVIICSCRSEARFR